MTGNANVAKGFVFLAIVLIGFSTLTYQIGVFLERVRWCEEAVELKADYDACLKSGIPK